MSSERLSHPNAAVREIAIRDLISVGGAENQHILAEHFKQEPELKLKYLIKEFLSKEAGAQKNNGAKALKKTENVVGAKLLAALRSTEPAMIKKAFAFAAENRIIAALPEMENICHQQQDAFLKTCVLRLQAVRGAIAIPAIMTYAADNNDEVAKTLVQVLDGMQNTAALAALCNALFSGSSAVKKVAGAYLHNVEREKMAYLLRKMESSDHEEYQRTALKMKEFLNWREDYPEQIKKTDTALFVIVKQLKETRDPKVIATALCAISGIKGETEIKKDLIMPFSRHQDGRVRANAIEALSYLMQASEKCFFADFLADKNNRVVANAIIAVCDSTDYQKKYRPAVLAALENLAKNHGEDGVFSALYCIGILQQEDFLPILELLFKKSRGKVRERTIQLFEVWATVSKKVAEVLQKLRNSEEAAFANDDSFLRNDSIAKEDPIDEDDSIAREDPIDGDDSIAKKGSLSKNDSVRNVSEKSSSLSLASAKMVKRDIAGMAALGRCLIVIVMIALFGFLYGFVGINISSLSITIFLFALMTVIFAALIYICAACVFCAHIPYRLSLAVFLALLFVLMNWTGWGMGAQIPMNVFEAFMINVRLGYWKNSQPGSLCLFLLYIMEFLFFTFLAFSMLSGWKKTIRKNGSRA